MGNNEVYKGNVGNAGEYYIASRLSALNFITTLTLGRAERYDIIAVGPKGSTVKLSVKTRLHKDIKSFPLSEKDEKNASDDFFYALVRLNEFKNEPDFWIIPSKRVCPLIKKAHKKFRTYRGQKHKTATIRKLPIAFTRGDRRFYPSNWEREISKYQGNLKQLPR